MSYSAAKTAKKTAPAFIVIILVNSLQVFLKAKNIIIDETTIWTIAATGLGAIQGFMNWIKHHKEKPLI